MLKIISIATLVLLIWFLLSRFKKKAEREKAEVLSCVPQEGWITSAQILHIFTERGLCVAVHYYLAELEKQGVLESRLANLEFDQWFHGRRMRDAQEYRRRIPEN